MKKLNGIIESSNPPEDTNLLWKKGAKLYIFNNGEWHDIDNDTKPMLNISEKLVPKTIINLKEDGTPYIGHFDAETGILYGPTTVEVAEGEYGGNISTSNLQPATNGVWVRGYTEQPLIAIYDVELPQTIIKTYTGYKYTFIPNNTVDAEGNELLPINILYNGDQYIIDFFDISYNDMGWESVLLPLGFRKAFMSPDENGGIAFSKIYLSYYEFSFKEVDEESTMIRYECRMLANLIYYIYLNSILNNFTGVEICNGDYMWNKTYVPTTRYLQLSDIYSYDAEFYFKGVGVDSFIYENGNVDQILTRKIFDKVETGTANSGNKFGLIPGARYAIYKENCPIDNIYLLAVSNGTITNTKRIPASLMNDVDKDHIVLPMELDIAFNLETSNSGSIKVTTPESIYNIVNLYNGTLYSSTKALVRTFMGNITLSAAIPAEETHTVFNGVYTLNSSSMMIVTISIDLNNATESELIINWSTIVKTL